MIIQRFTPSPGVNQTKYWPSLSMRGLFGDNFRYLIPNYDDSSL
jgi:hypothetical protein